MRWHCLSWEWCLAGGISGKLYTKTDCHYMNRKLTLSGTSQLHCNWLVSHLRNHKFLHHIDTIAWWTNIYYVLWQNDMYAKLVWYVVLCALKKAGQNHRLISGIDGDLTWILVRSAFPLSFGDVHGCLRATACGPPATLPMRSHIHHSNWVGIAPKSHHQLHTVEQRVYKQSTELHLNFKWTHHWPREGINRVRESRDWVRLTEGREICTNLIIQTASSSICLKWYSAGHGCNFPVWRISWLSSHVNYLLEKKVISEEGVVHAFNMLVCTI